MSRPMYYLRSLLTGDTWMGLTNRANSLAETARAMHIYGLPGRQDALDAAVRALAQAALTARVLSSLAVLADHDKRDALTEQEVVLLGALDGREPPVPVRRGVEALVDVLAELSGVLLGDLVGGAAVDDEGGHDSPSVGRHEGGSSTVDGAAALDTPPAGVPTVGAPTDTPAPLSSAAGVSVDRDLHRGHWFPREGCPACAVGQDDAGEMAKLLARDLRDVTSRQMLTTDALALALVDLGWSKGGD